MFVRDPGASWDAAAKLTDAKKRLQRETEAYTAAMQTEQWGNLNEARQKMKQVLPDAVTKCRSSVLARLMHCKIHLLKTTKIHLLLSINSQEKSEMICKSTT